MHAPYCAHLILINFTKSKPHCDRRSVGQSALVSSPFSSQRPNFSYCQTVAVLLMWGALSDEKTGLSFVAVIVNSTWRLYLQIYLSPSYTVVCQKSSFPCGYLLFTVLRVILAAILLHEFWYNSCDGHCSVFCLNELCRDLLKYRCDYLGHVVQIWTVCIRSLKWLTWYLLCFSGGGANLCSWGCCCYCVLLRCTAAKDSPEAVA
jgi:hypothetical protein